MTPQERNWKILAALLKIGGGWMEDSDPRRANDIAWLESLRDSKITDEAVIAVLWEKVKLYDAEAHKAFAMLNEAGSMLVELQSSGAAEFAERAHGIKAELARGPARVAAANAKRSKGSLEIADRARALRAAGMRWKGIGTELDRDPEYLRKLVAKLKRTAISSGYDETS